MAIVYFGRLVATLSAGFAGVRNAGFCLVLALSFGTSMDKVRALPAGQSELEKLQPPKLQEDFRVLYEGLQRAHIGLYSHRPKAVLDKAFADTMARLDRPMSRFEAQRIFQRFVAEGRVAHARIDPPMEMFGSYLEAGGRIFPFGVRIDGNRIYVSENLSGIAAIAPGDEIVTIDAKPAGYWLRQLRRQISADSQGLANAILEPQFTVALWFERGAIETFQVSIAKPGGRSKEFSIHARTPAEMRAAAAGSPSGLEIDPSVREAKIVGKGIAYLRPGVFMNTTEGGDPFNPSAFHAFIDQAFQRFLAEGATDLLIDLRNNPGGDNSFSDHMIAWFADRPFRFASHFRVKVSPEAMAANKARLADAPPESIVRQYDAAYARAVPGSVIPFEMPWVAPRVGARFTGRVFVLVNRRSFSNAVSVAAIVQDYRFGRIIGEPTVDLATTYGAMETFKLPNSGFAVGFPKAFIVRPNGDERLGGVTPDCRIETPIFEPTDDPVLRAALGMIGAKTLQRPKSFRRCGAELR